MTRYQWEVVAAVAAGVVVAWVLVVAGICLVVHGGERGPDMSTPDRDDLRPREEGGGTTRLGCVSVAIALLGLVLVWFFPPPQLAGFLAVAVVAIVLGWAASGGLE